MDYIHICIRQHNILTSLGVSHSAPKTKVLNE
jgi:hypothetical protein